MKQELKKLAHDFALWLGNQDENLLELPPQKNFFSEQNQYSVNSVDDLAAETEKNEALSAAEDALEQSRNKQMQKTSKKMRTLLETNMAAGFLL